MSKVIYKDWIQENLINDRGKLNPWTGRKDWWKRNGFIENYNEILKITNFLDNPLMQERIYCIINDITEYPKCKTCDNTTKYHASIKGYSEYCSSNCIKRVKKPRKPKKKTFKEIHGHHHYQDKEWLMNIYKNGHHSQSHLNKKLLNRLNDKEWLIEQHYTKRKTLIEIANEIGYKTSSSVCKAYKKFDIKILHFESSKEKSEKTCIKKYGVKNPAQNKEVKEKIKSTCLRKYGAETYAQSHISKESYEKLNDREWLIEQHHDKEYSLNKIGLDLGFANGTVIQKVFKKFNIEVRYSAVSFDEKSILKFIEENYDGMILPNDRKLLDGEELDIYLPELNIAFEYNGLYWHSELQGKRKNYHLNKTKLCEKKDIRLIHINENEWVNKQEIVKSRILNILGKSKKIYARKCEIKQIQDVKEFLIDNHIQGSCNSKINLGLYHENELVALMTFGKARFNKNIEWELLRFCNKLNRTVIGGASKLYKYFMKMYNPESVISYSDKRWNTGGLYTQLGMERQKSSPPNYWYFKGNEISSRVKFQKHKLANQLKIFDDSLTEWENMVKNGWNRIWDCGNDVYIFS